MSKILLIDSNVLLRHILDDHPDQSQKAKAFMDKVKDGEITAKIIEGVLVECVYVLLKVYEVPRVEIAGVLVDILEYIGITRENKSVYITGLKNFANNRVDIVDNLLAAFAEGDKELVSFDQDFAGLNIKTYRLS
ncbi:MAG: PIN domain-containing protein [bacterium]